MIKSDELKIAEDLVLRQKFDVVDEGLVLYDESLKMLGFVTERFSSAQRKAFVAMFDRPAISVLVYRRNQTKVAVRFEETGHTYSGVRTPDGVTWSEPLGIDNLFINRSMG